MAKKQISFADKAAKTKNVDAVYVKYVKSVRSEKTGQWRFNEQMVKTKKGEKLDVALKQLEEAKTLVDIDLSEFETKDESAEVVSGGEEQAVETMEETSGVESPVGDALPDKEASTEEEAQPVEEEPSAEVSEMEAPVEEEEPDTEDAESIEEIADSEEE
ncbi:MAG: DUF4295 family protein [Dehalococcoidia bacterium]|nr:DUF4295 family protein [Dehalococcoidia bacterium]